MLDVRCCSRRRSRCDKYVPEELSFLRVLTRGTSSSEEEEADEAGIV